MKDTSVRVCVYFDGACPKCVRDRDTYVKLAGSESENVKWVDITHKDAELKALGINPELALQQLHIKVESNNLEPFILRELDAYILLMDKTKWLKPVAWFISLPLIRPLLSKAYKYMVARRLKASGRL